MLSLYRSFRSEWLKKRRSLASYLVIAGGFFTPVIIIIARLINHSGLEKASLSPKYWQEQWSTAWESMAIFLLPMGIILAASLITQLEFKNNTWKQLHTTPQSLTVIFTAKLLVVLVMLVQCFVLFNIGIYLAGVVPGLILGIEYPTATIPFNDFLKGNINFFIDTLPILAIQYLISLRFKNFLIPVGVGMLFWIIALDALSWRYNYIFPYTYIILDYLQVAGKSKAVVNTQGLSLAFFVGVTILNYGLYLNKEDKG